ncbi:hypothetical protein ACJ72_01220 [Emergomyces africanus]|uniref:Uncharacterized protein n=1 Tax=Emergomyces africanus TaxID=1955775 RepID=A0A1B7P5V5_9EURO|nr:hypothetical protein ACJ72_01220 [Emergomyces africanus]
MPAFFVAIRDILVGMALIDRGQPKYRTVTANPLNLFDVELERISASEIAPLTSQTEDGTSGRSPSFADRIATYVRVLKNIHGLNIQRRVSGRRGGLGRVRSSMSTDKRQLAAGLAEDRGLATNDSRASVNTSGSEAT